MIGPGKNGTSGAGGALRPLDYFYYLAPAWLAAELWLWPGFRAGIVLGDSTAAVGAFYCAEGLIGVALWKGLRFAPHAALAENLLYLVLAFKYILTAPLDAAAALGADLPGAERFAREYVNSLPGLLYSILHVAIRLRAALSVNARGTT